MELQVDTIIYGGDSGHQHGCQNYIFLMTTAQKIKKTSELEVLVGQPNIKIRLNKINSLILNQLISGVQFEISATDANVSIDGGTTWANPVTLTTNGAEQEIEIKPDNEGVGGIINEIKVTLKEVGLEDPSQYLQYRDENGDPGSIEITYIWDTTTMEWKKQDIKVPKYDNGVEEKAELIDVEKNVWTLKAQNRPQVEKLSGYVWIDGVTGEKNIQGPNGIHDGSEGYKKGVKVYLFKTDGSKVEYDGYGSRFGRGGEGYLVTGDDGKYEFKNLPKLPDGESYYIVFEYDGINYIATTTGGESKAAETDRGTFNARFKTISAGSSNDGTSLEYTYSGNASTLITENRDGTVLEKFGIKADTKTAGNTYNETATDINLGITKKVVDLALMTDLHEAKATINGMEETKIVYNNKFDDNLQALIDECDAITNKDGKEWTKATWDAFQNQLALARKVNSNPNATQQEVDDAIDALQKAKLALKKSGSEAVDKAALKKLIDECKKLTNEGYKNYTKASWDVFTAALKKAETVYNNDKATSTEVENAYIGLKNAYSTLEETGFKTGTVPIDPDITEHEASIFGITLDKDTLSLDYNAKDGLKARVLFDN